MSKLKKTKFFIILAVWVASGAVCAEAETTSQPSLSAPTRQKLVMGWLESIFIKPWNRRLTAKLDTGAKTSSLHASQIEHFTKDGDDWVRFNLGDLEDTKSPPILVERPLVRTVNIKCKGEDCQPSKRDVVALTVCKNGKTTWRNLIWWIAAISIIRSCWGAVF